MISDDSDEGEVESGGGNGVVVLHSGSEADEGNRSSRRGRTAAEPGAAVAGQKGARSRKGKAAVASAALSAAAAALSAAVPPEAAERAATRRIASSQHPREDREAVTAGRSEQPVPRKAQRKAAPEEPQVRKPPPLLPAPSLPGC